MSQHKEIKRVTTHVLQEMKNRGEKISMLTAYDYSMASIVDQAGMDIILVGDQYRVDRITKYFDSIEFSTQKREFKSTTGVYKGKRITVLSTGIGPDNIDIVLNELDALVNIDLDRLY